MNGYEAHHIIVDLRPWRDFRRRHRGLHEERTAARPRADGHGRLLLSLRVAIGFGGGKRLALFDEFAFLVRLALWHEFAFRSGVALLVAGIERLNPVSGAAKLRLACRDALIWKGRRKQSEEFALLLKGWRRLSAAQLKILQGVDALIYCGASLARPHSQTSLFGSEGVFF